MLGLFKKISGKDEPIRVYVDKDICVGCEKCVNMCPEVFQMESEVAVVTVEHVSSEHHKACREAAEHCPVEAIVIRRQ